MPRANCPGDPKSGPFSLYQRFIDDGTISEPDGVPDPRRALPSMVHWMRALALAVKGAGLDFEKALTFYKDVGVASLESRHENSILEHLLLALHQLAALRSMGTVVRQSDIVRVASVSWYYGIYAAATAMIAAQDRSLQKNHAKTANVWHQHFVGRARCLYPFDLHVSTLVEADAAAEVDGYRVGAPKNLLHAPTSESEARDLLCGYLSGTVEWYSWQVRERLKKSPEFAALGFTDFRKKEARSLRDSKLAGRPVAFIHQAIRFRGKANYREALYLAHGKTVEGVVSSFTRDMADVLEAFLGVAGGFAFHRLGVDLSRSFLEDIEEHRSFSLSPRSVWGLV